MKPADQSQASSRKATSPFLAALAAIAVLTGFADHTRAERTWPARRVTIVVPTSAGTGTDIAMRILAKNLTDAYGQPFIVQNMPGADQTIGAAYVARATPDGYTLLAGGNTSHSAIRSLLKSVPYDPVNDFTPIARVIAYPIVIVTNRNQSFKTIRDMVAYAKSNPGKLFYGSGNASGQVVMEMIKRKLSLQIHRVPYKGNTPAVTDLLGDRVQLVVSDFANSVPFIRKGDLIPLALPALTRSAVLPDVPTLNETVIPHADVLPWGGLYGPAHLPYAIAQGLSDAVGKALGKPEVASLIRKVALEPYYLPMDPFAQFSASQVPFWTALVKDAGIKAQ